ncbi:hydroxycarboxylic acid receptor 1-like [Chiloscyllium plagiosum]|uniref:hydroxycarboxylic acid receptor 1-like n=1 Tax=Chiloscyllium plagiosum TaxID=36176 RepID=UPI001CB828F1|nr:hydroxycarboxylic acid receptor 1-like [Chiloscyllium plagiosum]
MVSAQYHEYYYFKFVKCFNVHHVSQKELTKEQNYIYHIGDFIAALNIKVSFSRQQCNDEYFVEFDGTTLINIVIPLLLVEFILESIGNAVALWIFCFRWKPWKLSTIYLFNLTIADFLLMCCLPFRLAYCVNKKDWILGDIVCRVLFMVSLNRAGSTAFFTLAAIDRYFKVVQLHHKFNSVSQRYAIVGVSFTWTLMLLMTSYLLFERHVFEQKNLTYCESFHLYESFNVAATWHDVFFVVEFVTPLCIILFCTFSIISKLQHKHSETREKYKKAIRIVKTVV